jgi:hypothetical protein
MHGLSYNIKLKTFPGATAADMANICQTDINGKAVCCYTTYGDQRHQ